MQFWKYVKNETIVNQDRQEKSNQDEKESSKELDSQQGEEDTNKEDSSQEKDQYLEETEPQQGEGNDNQEGLNQDEKESSKELDSQQGEKDTNKEDSSQEKDHYSEETEPQQGEGNDNQEGLNQDEKESSKESDSQQEGDTNKEDSSQENDHYSEETEPQQGEGNDNQEGPNQDEKESSKESDSQQEGDTNKEDSSQDKEELSKDPDSQQGEGNNSQEGPNQGEEQPLKESSPQGESQNNQDNKTNDNYETSDLKDGDFSNQDNLSPLNNRDSQTPFSIPQDLPQPIKDTLSVPNDENTYPQNSDMDSDIQSKKEETQNLEANDSSFQSKDKEASSGQKTDQVDRNESDSKGETSDKQNNSQNNLDNKNSEDSQKDIKREENISDTSKPNDKNEKANKLDRSRLNSDDKEVKEEEEKAPELTEATNQFLGQLSELPSFENRSTGPGYSIDTSFQSEIPESIIKTLITKFLNQRFCKKVTDLNVRSNSLIKTHGFHKWEIKDVVVHLKTRQVTKVLTDKYGYEYAQGKNENVPLSFYFDLSGSMSEYSNMLAIIAIELLKKGVKVLVGFNETVSVQIDSIDKNITISELVDLLTCIGYYSLQDYSGNGVKYKVVNRNLDRYLIEKKAEKCVVFSDFDPKWEVINLSHAAEVYWFCFENRFSTFDLDKFNGFVYKVQNLSDLAQGLIKVSSKRFKTLCYTENPIKLQKEVRLG